MDELIKQLRDEYIEDIRRVVPLSRALLVIYFWMQVAVFRTGDFNGPLSSLMVISISDFFSFESGLLWKVSPFDVILVVVVSLITIWAYRIFSVGIFDAFIRVRNPKAAFQRMVDSAKSVITNSEEENTRLGKEIDKLFRERTRSLSFRIKFGEVVFGISLGLIMFAKFLTIADVVLLVGCSVLVLFIQLNIYRYYFSKAAPVIVQRLVLAGQLPKFGDGVLEEVEHSDKES